MLALATSPNFVINANVPAGHSCPTGTFPSPLPRPVRRREAPRQRPVEPVSARLRVDHSITFRASRKRRNGVASEPECGSARSVLCINNLPHSSANRYAEKNDDERILENHREPCQPTPPLPTVLRHSCRTVARAFMCVCCVNFRRNTEATQRQKPTTHRSDQLNVAPLARAALEGNKRPVLCQSENRRGLIASRG